MVQKNQIKWCGVVTTTMLPKHSSLNLWNAWTIASSWRFHQQWSLPNQNKSQINQLSCRHRREDDGTRSVSTLLPAATAGRTTERVRLFLPTAGLLLSHPQGNATPQGYFAAGRHHREDDETSPSLLLPTAGRTTGLPTRVRLYFAATRDKKDWTYNGLLGYFINHNKHAFLEVQHVARVLLAIFGGSAGI